MDVVVVGGGICGTAAAMMLARDGHGVTVLDRDPGPVPASVEAAWRDWERPSVAQFRLAHFVLARSRQILAAELPDLLDDLVAAGALQMPFTEPPTIASPSTRDGDDRFDVVTARRPVLEWVFARAVEAEPGVELRRGVAVDGLVVGAEAVPGAPHVTGVRLSGGEELAADLVVDATGRRSPTLRWLEAAGAKAPSEDSVDSGFAYYGRFFRSADGSTPPIMAPILSPVGSMSVLTIPSDNGTWSITLYGTSTDAPLRRLRDPEVFQRVVAECPLHAHWLDGEPISDMASMTGVVDRDRRFVVDGVPVVTGLLPVGDAWACTNPSLGRGVSIGLMHVAALRRFLAGDPGGPAETALGWDAVTQEQLRPWHDATRSRDQLRLEEMKAAVSGDPGAVDATDPGRAIGNALVTALAHDGDVFRWFLEIQHCLALPQEVLAREGVFEHLLEAAAGLGEPVIPGPDRARLLELVS